MDSPHTRRRRPAGYESFVEEEILCFVSDNKMKSSKEPTYLD